MSQPNAFGVFLTIFLCSRQVDNLNRFSTSSADLIDLPASHVSARPYQTSRIQNQLI